MLEETNEMIDIYGGQSDACLAVNTYGLYADNFLATIDGYYYPSRTQDILFEEEYGADRSLFMDSDW